MHDAGALGRLPSRAGRLSSRSASSSKRASMVFMMPALSTACAALRWSSRSASSSSRCSRSRNTAWPCSMASPWRRSSRSGEHVEPLLDAAENVIGVRCGRRAVELVGYGGDLGPASRSIAFSGSLPLAAISSTRCDSRFRRSIISPTGPSSTSSSICRASEVMRASIRSNGSGSKCVGRRGRRRCDDRPRDLVEAFLDDFERRAAAAVLLAREMIDRAGQRADFLLQRTQRKRFGEAVDGLVDLLEAHGQRLDCRIGRARMRLRVETILEFAEAGVEIVPAPVDRAHSVLARQRVERTAHLLQLESQQLDVLVVGLFGQRLYGARQPLEFGAEFGAVLGGERRGIGALDVLAQRIEFARQPGGHLMPQFLAQALQLAGDLADLRRCCPPGRARGRIRAPATDRPVRFPACVASVCAGGCRRTVLRDAPALPSGRDCAGQDRRDRREAAGRAICRRCGQYAAPAFPATC